MTETEEDIKRVEKDNTKFFQQTILDGLDKKLEALRMQEQVYDAKDQADAKLKK